MSPEIIVGALVIGMAAGAFGSVLGLGGGLFMVPLLTALTHGSLKTAIAASIVATIATSLSAGSVYIRNQLADVKLGLLLLIGTVPAAIAAANLASRISPRALAGVFAAFLAVSAYHMIRRRRTRDVTLSSKGVTGHGDNAGPKTSLAQRLNLRRSYWEPALGEEVPYEITNVGAGVGISVLAGLLSGLLGVGGGVVQVPVMTVVMNVPVKVATTTSTFMIGVTAMAGASVYYSRGLIDPVVAVPVTIGVFVGASVGSRLLVGLSGEQLRRVFVAVMVIFAVDMALRAAGVVST